MHDYHILYSQISKWHIPAHAVNPNFRCCILGGKLTCSTNQIFQSWFLHVQYFPPVSWVIRFNKDSINNSLIIAAKRLSDFHARYTLSLYFCYLISMIDRWLAINLIDLAAVNKWKSKPKCLLSYDTQERLTIDYDRLLYVMTHAAELCHKRRAMSQSPAS